MGAASRNDIRSSRGNIEPHHGYYNQVNRRSSTTYPAGPSPTEHQAQGKPTKAEQRKDRRQSCPNQTSSAFEHRASIPASSSSTHLHTRPTTQTPEPPAATSSFSTNSPAPAAPYSSTVTPSPSPSPSPSQQEQPTSIMEPTRSVSPALSPTTTPTTTAPPSAVLLRDLVRDRATPSPSAAGGRPLSSISPSISPTHSRSASLANFIMPPIHEDSTSLRRKTREGSSIAQALDDVYLRRSSHLSCSVGGGQLLPAGGSASYASLESSLAPGGQPAPDRRASYYQYGEDYITRYDRAGMTPSPAPSGLYNSLLPRSASPASTRASSVLYSSSNNNVDGAVHQSQPAHLPGTYRQGSRSTMMWDAPPPPAPAHRKSSTFTTTTTTGGWGDDIGSLGRDVEKAGSERSGSQGAASSLLTCEKMMLRRSHKKEKGERWVSWPRLLAFVLAVLVLACIAVGIGFGIKR